MNKKKKTMRNMWTILEFFSRIRKDSSWHHKFANIKIKVPHKHCSTKFT